MTNSAKRFLIVDDDPANNIISMMALKKLLGEVEIKDFVVPEVALNYIENELEFSPTEEKITLFLDINMPTLTGWEFLDKFKKFKEPIQEHFSIYILSSSIDPCDIQRAKRNPFIVDFIEKPLNKATLMKFFG